MSITILHISVPREGHTLFVPSMAYIFRFHDRGSCYRRGIFIDKSGFTRFSGRNCSQVSPSPTRSTKKTNGRERLLEWNGKETRAFEHRFGGKDFVISGHSFSSVDMRKSMERGRTRHTKIMEIWRLGRHASKKALALLKAVGQGK